MNKEEWEATFSGWKNLEAIYSGYGERDVTKQLHDDCRHFELMVLEIMKAGFTWIWIIERAEIIGKAFAGFDYKKVAAYTEEDIEAALKVPGMIQSKARVKAVTENAGVFMRIQKEHGSFDKWLWSFSKNGLYTFRKNAAGYALAHQISRELDRQGMKYLNEELVFTHLWAAGIINDHNVDCWLYRYINC